MGWTNPDEWLRRKQAPKTGCESNSVNVNRQEDGVVAPKADTIGTRSVTRTVLMTPSLCLRHLNQMTVHLNDTILIVAIALALYLALMIILWVTIRASNDTDDTKAVDKPSVKRHR